MRHHLARPFERARKVAAVGTADPAAVSGNEGSGMKVEDEKGAGVSVGRERWEYLVPLRWGGEVVGSADYVEPSRPLE